MLECCCTGSKLGVGLLLYRGQIVCGSGAVQGENCVWLCCCTGSELVVGFLL